MIKWIIKTNDWYDNLKSTKRLLFFLFVIMIPILISQYLQVSYDIWCVFPILVILIVIWRGTALIVNRNK